LEPKSTFCCLTGGSLNISMALTRQLVAQENTVSNRRRDVHKIEKPAALLLNISHVLFGA
jgi:hypothetical protein